MTEITASSAAHSGRGDHQFDPRLDRLFDRIESGETSLSGEGSFERVLLEELRQSTDRSLSSPQPDGGKMSAGEAWAQIEASASSSLDADRVLQNGNLYTIVGHQSEIGSEVGDSDFLERAAQRVDADFHPQKVTFDADLFSTLHADVHDQDGQARQTFDDMERPSAIDDGDVRCDGSIVDGLDGETPAFGLPMDHVFFNGDGRPILLTSFADDISMPVIGGGDQIILPDGAVFDYHSTEQDRGAAHRRWTDMQASFEPISLTTRILLENNFE